MLSISGEFSASSGDGTTRLMDGVLRPTEQDVTSYAGGTDLLEDKARLVPADARNDGEDYDDDLNNDYSSCWVVMMMVVVVAMEMMMMVMVVVVVVAVAVAVAVAVKRVEVLVVVVEV